MDNGTICETPEVIVDPPKSETPEVIVDPPKSVSPSDQNDTEKDYDGTSSHTYGTELGFKHVHFPEDSSLVKIVFFPPNPKKVCFVKKVAKKLCCS